MQAYRSILVAEDPDQIRCGDRRQLKGGGSAVIGTEQGIESFGRLGRRHSPGRAASKTNQVVATYDAGVG